MVIIRDDMLERVPANLPSMLKYTTYTSKNSLYNTPPSFAIYTVQLVLKWIEETVGGLGRMEALNRKKAAVVYRGIDNSGGFYRGTAEPGSRSLMNLTFRLPSEELEKRFLDEALKAGLSGLKGHRSVGGCRASLYNAVLMEGIDALADFMQTFARNNG
jgi:phosphoserine aminotransferase